MNQRCRFVFEFAQNDIPLNDEEPFIKIVMKSFVRIYQERKSERGERMWIHNLKDTESNLLQETFRCSLLVCIQVVPFSIHCIHETNSIRYRFVCAMKVCFYYKIKYISHTNKNSHFSHSLNLNRRIVKYAGNRNLYTCLMKCQKRQAQNSEIEKNRKRWNHINVYENIDLCVRLFA